MTVNKHDSMTHEQAVELLPWLVNDSLPAAERRSLLEHSRDCILCRRDVAALESLQMDITNGDEVEHIPDSDMRRINRRIDDYEASRKRIRHLYHTVTAWLSRPLHVALTAQSVIILVLLAALLVPRQEPSVYTTLTSASELPEGEYARVVVSTRMSNDSWNALLARFGLSAAEGPSDRGVATLAFDESLPGAARQQILAELARHPDVRFVQPLTVPSP